MFYFSGLSVYALHPSDFIILVIGPHIYVNITVTLQGSVLQLHVETEE